MTDITTPDPFQPVTFLSERRFEVDAASHLGVLVHAIMRDANLRVDDGYLCVLVKDSVLRKQIREMALIEAAQLILSRVMQMFGQTTGFIHPDITLIPPRELHAELSKRVTENGEIKDVFRITRTWRPEGFTPQERLQRTYLIELVGFPESMTIWKTSK